MSNIHSWARLINAYEEIPEAFKERFLAITGHPQKFPYIIYSPSDRWGNKQTNEKLICLSGESLTIYEKTKEDIVHISYLTRDINFIQRRSVLLRSWIKICGVVSDKVITTTIEYNTVVKKLFNVIIKSLRLSASSIKESTQQSNLESLEDFIKLEYRFKHYARECLMPGQEVIAMCFQPSIYLKKLFFFEQIVSNSHLCILTDKELIFINEGELISAKSQKYEDIYTFIPLEILQEIVIEESEDKINIKLILKWHSEIQILYCLSKKVELKSFVSSINNFMLEYS